jgi:putative ABC transport system permease protein
MSSRFDLEKAVAAWRRSLEYNSALLREDVDELESHVRDQVRGLVLRGLTEEEAFERAVRQMGGYGTVESEYQKVYWGKVRRRHELTHELKWRASMYKNYLKTAFRNLFRHKGYSAINIIGLTIGLTCCLLIFQFVAFEYSFDTFHENAPNLYRISRTAVRNGELLNTSALNPHALGPALKEAVPEVVRFARLHPDYNNPIVLNPAHPERAFDEERLLYADPAFLQMFSYSLISGDTASALDPGTMLISERAARRYFVDEDPVGQTLEVVGYFNEGLLVNGVFKDFPPNSHLQFDFLVPMADLLQSQNYRDPETAWGWWNFNTYVQLPENVNLAEVEQKFTDVLMVYEGDGYRQSGTSVHVNVQPLGDIHLSEEVEAAPMTIVGSRQTVYFFTIVGLVTLFIALVNYVNLATSRALDRAREVGVRKVVGARRRQLVTQFFFESALTNLVAFILAAGFAAALRPALNNLAGTNLPGLLWGDPAFWLIFLATFFTSTLLAGMYPALVLSSFKPVSVLKGKGGSYAARSWLRQGLVVLQFAASVMLVAGTAVVYTQLGYMRNMDLGIELEQILTVRGPRVLEEGVERPEAVRTLIQELRQIPAVRQIATSSSVPGSGFIWYSSARRATADPSTDVNAVLTGIDSSFASMYGLELVAGRGFERIAEVPQGEPFPVIPNETVVRAIGFDSPAEAVDQIVNFGGVDARIVGVFKDFNWSSAHAVRENAFFGLDYNAAQLSIKVSTENLPQTIAAIERIYTTLFPGNPFRYAFANEQFDQQYRNDQRFATLFSIFAGLAIFIACLGLFGLAAFTAQQRTKEIGVRKVLGASVGSIVRLLSSDFMKLVLIAFVLAAPLAYFGMQRWLEGFAYRIDIGPGVFIVTGFLVLLIALLTVSYQSIKAALADPVKSLRYE